jgi:tetratricopeptide (TPR) repeat protein
MAIDLDALWDFNRPEVSEQRFRDALAGASPDEQLILQTQIARTHGLRREFDKAQAQLAALQPAIAGAGAEARVRWWLETGRSLASATHRPDELTPQARDAARQAFGQALAAARAAQLDALAIDAIHMFTFVDTAPDQQLRHAQDALAIALASRQPAAQRWAASIRHNLGLAWHRLGRFDEALAQFQQAQALRATQGDARRERIARWMVAWTLRAQQRLDEALAMQLQLEQELDVAGAPDPFVFEELEALYRAKGDASRTAVYAARLKAARP